MPFEQEMLRVRFVFRFKITKMCLENQQKVHCMTVKYEVWNYQKAMARRRAYKSEHFVSITRIGYVTICFYINVVIR